MFAHVRGQDNIYQPRSDCLVHVRVQLGEDVDPVVAVGQFEAQSTVMVLQDSCVIVKYGQLTARVTQVGTVLTRMVYIVNNGTWNILQFWQSEIFQAKAFKIRSKSEVVRLLSSIFEGICQNISLKAML